MVAIPNAQGTTGGKTSETKKAKRGASENAKSVPFMSLKRARSRKLSMVSEEEREGVCKGSVGKKIVEQSQSLY